MDLVSRILDSGTNFNMAIENVLGVFSNFPLWPLLVLSLMKDKQFPKTKDEFKDEYDYIIIGGGTAGSVMANRLSQKPCVSVLLLEAGGEGSLLTDVPSLARMFHDTDIDWQYKTTPQKYGGFGYKENRVLWNSGKALGGGSVLNAMLHVRGNAKNYDTWKAEGATGWGYEDVLPYFMKLEDNTNIGEFDQDYHGTHGPMTMEKPKYTPEFKNPVLRAVEATGYEIRDINGRHQTGIYDLQATMRNGQRCSTAKAYLVPAEDRPNLDILKYAFAKKILIKDKKAFGVEFDFGGKTNTVYAKKEVVVSSGTVRTAQILMLSGIGPKKHLEDFHIPVVADLPVGLNLHDHPLVLMAYTVNSTISPVTTKFRKTVNLLKYIVNRSGPLSSPNQCTVLAFVDGQNSTSLKSDFPVIELYFGEYTAVDMQLNSNLRPEVFEQVYKPYIEKPGYACGVSHLQPKSRGEIKLKSIDPYDHPLINPNYFKEESDVKDIVAGMKFCHTIAKSPQMQEVQAKPYETVFPGCEAFIGNEDIYLTCQARSIISTAWHPVGTARMGHPNDTRSVVDPQLKVIGVGGLRVVNAAVMPIVPSANTNVPTMMVAEKAYDMMKKDISCREKNERRGKLRNCRRRRSG